VQSNRQLRLLSDRYGAPVERLTNAVDSDFYAPDAEVPRDGHVILTVARLVDGQKRISDLIEALARLPAEWRLEIAGSGPDEGMLRALAERLGVAGRIGWHGFVADPETLRDLYRRCAVYAQPSKFEAMTLTVLEAMACGAAPVVSRLPTFTDLIDDGVNGLIVDVGDPHAIARAIERADDRRDLIGFEARRTVVASYDKRKNMRRLAQIVREAAADG
jgi:glycosyltransferase involved in cell wall biosynthesis